MINVEFNGVNPEPRGTLIKINEGLYLVGCFFACTKGGDGRSCTVDQIDEIGYTKALIRVSFGDLIRGLPSNPDGVNCQGT